MIGTGAAKATSCQPLAVSALAVASASCVPSADQRLTTCVPVLPAAL